jgi:hypothetical protein
MAGWKLLLYLLWSPFCICCCTSAYLFLSLPESKSPKDQSTFQKLVHINTTALLEHPEYKGPFLPASAVAPIPSPSNKKMTPLQKELQETLKALLGNTDKGSLEVATQYGWVLGKGSPSVGKKSKSSSFFSCM